MPDPTSDQTFAVVVTYHPDDGFPDRARLIADEVRAVVVVDNGSGPDARAMLRRLAADDARIRLIENADNLGIAEGLNVGVRAGAAAGFRWVLLFDQDTAVHPGALRVLADARAAHPAPATVRLVGSSSTGAAGRLFRPGGRAAYRTPPFVLTSGSLLSVETFQEVGPFRADFFIDSVDREYAYRVRAAGYRVLLATRPGMTHACGAPAAVAAGPFRFTPSFHSPLRRYYITRNWLVVIARYFPREPVPCLREAATLAVETAYILAVEGDRVRKARAVVRGVFDAVRGRMGRSHPAWLEGSS